MKKYTIGGAFILLLSLFLFFAGSCSFFEACGCESGWVKNSFADGSAMCCPPDYPYYCDGTDKCYKTWEDAYYGNPCTLPQDREVCP